MSKYKYLVSASTRMKCAMSLLVRKLQDIFLLLHLIAMWKWPMFVMSGFPVLSIKALKNLTPFHRVVKLWSRSGFVSPFQSRSGIVSKFLAHLVRALIVSPHAFLLSLRILWSASLLSWAVHTKRANSLSNKYAGTKVMNDIIAKWAREDKLQ